MVMLILIKNNWKTTVIGIFKGLKPTGLRPQKPKPVGPQIKKAFRNIYHSPARWHQRRRIGHDDDNTFEFGVLLSHSRPSSSSP